jgi:hypothetical protein
MFRALLCPSSGARQTAVASSCFRMNVEVEEFSAVVGLLANLPRLRILPPPHSYGKQRLQRQFEGGPDDGHGNARNMLSSVCMTKQQILRLIIASSWVFYLKHLLTQNVHSWNRERLYDLDLSFIQLNKKSRDIANLKSERGFRSKKIIFSVKNCVSRNVKKYVR